MHKNEPLDSSLFPKAFGNAMKNRRIELKISQEDLGFRCGLDRTYISGIERGVRNPTIQNGLRIATALEIPFSTLIKEAERIFARKGGKDAL